MATNKIEMHVDLVRNTNQKSDYYGKYYGRAVRTSTLNTRGLSEHISQHGSIWTVDVVEGILRKLAQCVPELVGQGVAVKLDGLGTFFPTLENKKEGASTAADFNVGENIVGVHIRYTPEGEELDRITSRAFKEKVQLSPRNVVEITKTTVEGKVKRTQKYTPIDQWVEPTPPTP